TDYTAAGVYNQYIYIDPVTNVVIAKTSSNHRFTSERQESKDTHIAMFREIARTANNIENN
ncbi:serine hydrolase, partial [Gammaproteobacteria bacterium]|nr:serine hydrolase [Gammaproteobacteria bacterium]